MRTIRPSIAPAALIGLILIVSRRLRRFRIARAEHGRRSRPGRGGRGFGTR